MDDKQSQNLLETNDLPVDLHFGMLSHLTVS